MKPSSECLCLILAAVVMLSVGGCTRDLVRTERTRVVAHRGASGYLPEHTLEAYAAAYFMGADLIEPDVIATRDGQLICMHDLYLERVTDVEQRYPDRQRADGHWYAIDFDMEEIQHLQVHGRNDAGWEGFRIATFEQMLVLIDRLNEQTGRKVGVVPELKDPAFHLDEGVELGTLMISVIERTGWDTRECIFQCFDAATLRELHRRYGSRFTLLQLISDSQQASDLGDVATYAWGIGPSRKVIDADPGIVERAHQLGLRVIPYTFKNDPEALRHYARTLRVDAVFADYPDIASDVVGGK